MRINVEIFHAENRPYHGPHYPHHLTQRGNNGVDVFLDDEDNAKYLSLLKEYSERLAVDVWAYCLMTNHVHLLAVPAGDVPLSRCIGRTNLLYTQHFNRASFGKRRLPFGIGK